MSSLLTAPAGVLGALGAGSVSAWLFLVVVGVVLLGVLWRVLRRVRRPRPHPAPPRAGGRPEVGEIWWAEVPFEDGSGSKDRPCLVVAVRGSRFEVLTITSRDRAGRDGWVPISRAGWARREGDSWLRVDRQVPLEAFQFRRYAGPCPPRVWEKVQQG